MPLPPQADVRPTPDRARETLFNWLSPLMPGATCLDLYAGSGVLGFEALSRGARRLVAVERSADAAAALEAFRQRVAHELEHELRGSADIVCADASSYLSRPGIGPFDVVFVDPPYALAVEPVLRALLPLLAPNARLYLERARSDVWPEIEGLDWVRKSSAGAVAFGLATPAERRAVSPGRER